MNRFIVLIIHLVLYTMYIPVLYTIIYLYIVVLKVPNFIPSLVLYSRSAFPILQSHFSPLPPKSPKFFDYRVAIINQHFLTDTIFLDATL